MKQPPRRLFEDEDRSGFAFREIFTPNREGPLPQRPHPSGKGGSSIKPKASVWSTADAATNGMTLTNGGRTITPSGLAAWRSIRSSTSRTAGKLYIEFAVSGSIDSGINILFGLASSGFNIGSFLGDSNYSGGTRPTVANYASVGFTNTADATLSAAAVTNDVWALAVDFAAGNIWLARNNTWQAGGNPGLGSSPMMTFILATVGSLSAAMTFQGNPGVWTVQPGPASQKYLPPIGFQAWDGGPVTPTPPAATAVLNATEANNTLTGAGAVTSPQSLAYLARTVGGNEGGNAVNIATLINGLVADGVWANLDVLYVFAQQNVTDAALNLIGPTYNATVTTAGTFTAYRGLTGFQYDTGFNPSTAPSPHHTQNLASMGLWSNCSPQEGISQMGNTALSTINTWHTDGNLVMRINNASVSGAASPAAEGLYGGDRANSAGLDPVFNGAYRTNKGGASSPPGNATFVIGKYSSGALTLQTLRAAYIGGSLGATLNLALYNRLRTYLTAVGSP